jgi:hypothetical protein
MVTFPNFRPEWAHSKFCFLFLVTESKEFFSNVAELVHAHAQAIFIQPAKEPGTCHPQYLVADEKPYIDFLA